MPNGITTAFMSLVKSLDPEQYTITVVIEPDAVFGKPEHLDKYRQLPDYVRVVPRVGAQLRTADENEIIKRFNGPGNGIDATAQRGHEASYNREFSRIFGESHFDVIVDFEGYSSHWAAILGLSGRSKARHIIYLHNDMVAEWEMRFPSLSRTFELYKEFDALISVSKSVHQVNMSGLAARSGLPNSAFVWADNFVDVSQILQGGLDDVPNSLSHLFSESVTTFSTMGRLSPEKDHAKLIRAFALVHDEYPQTRLVILGDGPLRQTLNVQIAAAGLLDKVILVGLLENPFAIVKKSDCFVFSSNYEGQGLALVEALILGVPVVSTDVVGPRSVLEYGHGLLVENSIEGLVGGMRSYLSGAMNYPIFDPVDYQTRAAEQFKTAISHSQTNHV